MYEHRSEPLISTQAFTHRLLRQLAIAGGFTVVSLLIGIMGYRWFESMPWIDALLNASMILGGMGEIDVLKTAEGKIFASLYALYSGLWAIGCMSLLIAPVFHRALHRFHADETD